MNQFVWFIIWVKTWFFKYASWNFLRDHGSFVWFYKAKKSLIYLGVFWILYNMVTSDSLCSPLRIIRLFWILNQFHNFADSAAARGLTPTIIPCCSLLVAWLVAALDLSLGVTMGEGAGVISWRGVRQEPCRGEGAAIRGRGEAGGGHSDHPGAAGGGQLSGQMCISYIWVWLSFNILQWKLPCGLTVARILR